MIAGDEKLTCENDRVLLLTALLPDTSCSQGKHREAENIHSRIVQTRQSKQVIIHRETLNGMLKLANTIELQGWYEEAKQQYEHILKLIGKTTVVGKNWIACMRGLASIMVKRRNYEKTEELFRYVVIKRDKLLGSGHPVTLISLNELAVVTIAQERFEEAELTLKQGLGLLEQAVGINSLVPLSAMQSLSFVQYKQRRYQEALATHHQVLQGHQTMLGPDNSEIVLRVELYNTMLKAVRFERKLRDVMDKLRQQQETLQEHETTLRKFEEFGRLKEVMQKQVESLRPHGILIHKEVQRE